MKMKQTLLTTAVLSIIASTGAAVAEEVQRLETVEVVDTELEAGPGARRVAPALEVPAADADTSAALARTPGANVVRNGGLTGIAQLRGLFNERVRVEVDGMEITPACPNHMDPPLHYSAPSELDSLVVLPGITPVSEGGDSIAGTIKAKSIDPEFFGDGVGVRGEAGAGYSGMNEGRFANARAETGNDRAVLTVDGSWSRANDTDFAKGRIADTGYQTKRGAVRVDADTGGGRAFLELGAHRSEDVGTPTLPMDMVKDDADRVRLGYTGTHGGDELQFSAYWHDIDHLMDNFSLRPNPGMRMEAPSTSRNTGLELRVARPAGSGTLRFGAEAHANEFDAFQRNVATRAVQDIMRDATRERTGLFVEWDQGGRQGLSAQYGVRADYVQSDADNVTHSFPPSAADRTAFNARDHDKSEWHWDATALWRYSTSDAVGYHFGLARKTRSPSLLERYLWTPLSASAGQADGRTYLGNLDLRPEISHQASLGIEFKTGGSYLRLSVFYNRVTDYIQGAPIARLDTSGNPVLQYRNFDAELYGIDGDWRYELSDAFALGGTLSYVRAENKDTDDNLYRIAPLNGVIHADYRMGAWTHRFEVQGAARQDRVANFNDEQESDAWAIANLRTEWQGEWLRLRAGVENLLDENYHDHLSGFNRVNDGDVAVGDPIPGAGRFAYVNATIYW